MSKGGRRSRGNVLGVDVDINEIGADASTLDKLTKYAFGKNLDDEEDAVELVAEETLGTTVSDFLEQHSSDQTDFDVYISAPFVGMYENANIHIKNHVVQARLNVERLDWRTIIPRCHRYGLKYATKRFGAIDMACNVPKGSMRTYSSGLISCSGAQSCSDAVKLIESMISIFQGVCDRDGNPFYPGLTMKSIKLVNLVGDIELGYLVDLEALKATDIAKYEPEKWPTACIRLRDIEPNYYKSREVVALVSSEGKIVITGATSREDLVNVYRHILPFLESCAQYNPETKKPMASRQYTEDSQRRAEKKRMVAQSIETLKLNHICKTTAGASMMMVPVTQERKLVAQNDRLRDTLSVTTRNLLALHSIDQDQARRQEEEAMEAEVEPRSKKNRVMLVNDRDAKILASLITDDD